MQTIERMQQQDPAQQKGPAQQPVSLPGTAAGTDIWAAGAPSCPEDCHYCSGPETD